MKKFKKAVSLALASAMVVSLAACGSNGGSEGSADGETWKIGTMGPITGGGAIYGLAVKNGAQIAVDEINAAGGINGYQVEYKYEDDELDNEKSVNAFNTLCDWGMQIVMGAVTSGCSTAVASETANANMFMITPSGSSTDIIEGKTNVFQVCFTDPNQGIASAQYIGENKLATKVAAIYNSSDVYSSGIYEKFKEEVKNYDIEIVAEGAFTADNKTDFFVQLQQAKDKGAELVFLPIYYQEASLILAQADQMGYAPTFFGCDGMDGILGVENFDTGLAEGLMLLTPFAADADDEMTQKFVAAYEEAYGGTPNQFAADSYDAVYAVKTAAEHANVTADMSVSDICEALKTAMTEITLDGLTGDGITWSADGEPTKSPKAVMIQEGAYVAME